MPHRLFFNYLQCDRRREIPGNTGHIGCSLTIYSDLRREIPGNTGHKGCSLTIYVVTGDEKYQVTLTTKVVL